LHQGRLACPDAKARSAGVVTAKDSGLINDALLQDGFAPPLKLEQGSIFAPPDASQAGVFASVASAFQTMRTALEPNLPLLGPRRHPLRTYPGPAIRRESGFSVAISSST